MMCETRPVHSGLSHHRPRAAYDRMYGRGGHQYQHTKTLSPSKAGGYDFTTLARFNSGYPLLSGGHNGFPRRIPTASSDKLRQMYMKTDRLSGRIVFNTVHHQAAQRRLEALLDSIDVGNDEEQLEAQNPNREADIERLEEHVHERRLTNTPTIPLPHSSRGLTVITEKASTSRRDLRADNSQLTTGSHQTQLSVYLPRADQLDQEQADTTPKVIRQNASSASASTRPSSKQTKPLRRRVRPHTAKW